MRFPWPCEFWTRQAVSQVIADLTVDTTGLAWNFVTTHSAVVGRVWGQSLEVQFKKKSQLRAATACARRHKRVVEVISRCPTSSAPAGKVLYVFHPL